MRPEHTERVLRFVDMLTILEAQQRTQEFLTGQMLQALQAVEYQLPSFDSEPHPLDLPAAACATVDIRHVRGASDASYLVGAFGDELLMQLQLNVHRLVVVYRVPGVGALDASSLAVHLDRWRIGAEHAGWKFGWRDARSQTKLAGAMSRPIVIRSPHRIFSKTSANSCIGAPILFR